MGIYWRMKMGFFKKRITAAELGEYLADAVAMTIHIPANKILIINYLVESTSLDEKSARFEIICLLAIVFDNAVLANVSSVHRREDVLNSFYYTLKDILQQWTDDTEGIEKALVFRIAKYHEALETRRLASGTPAITREFMDVCIGEEEGSLDDYVYFTSQTMALLANFTETAQYFNAHRN